VNQTKEGDESTKVLIDDLQCLLTEHPLTGTQDQIYFQSSELPADYLFFKSVMANAKTDCCPDRRLVVYLAPVADVTNLLFDQLRSPSAEWGETFCTLIDNKVRIYHDGKFQVTGPKLTYYRNPVNVQFNGCVDLATGQVSTVDVECEFKDDVAELIVDEAASILAGDMESVLQYQRTQTTSTQNN
jgi:hypothetical protein